MLHESPVLLKSWLKLQSEASSLNTATCYKYRSCPNSPQPHEELGKLVLLPSPHPPIYPTAAKGGSMEGWKESSGCEVQAWRKGASAGAGMPASNPPAQYREGSESISHREGGINLHTYSLAVGLSKGSCVSLSVWARRDWQLLFTWSFCDCRARRCGGSSTVGHAHHAAQPWCVI